VHHQSFTGAAAPGKVVFMAARETPLHERTGEITMAAALIVRHRVANFEAWKAVFDSMTEIRRSHGWRSAIVYRDASDPNVVTIVNRVKDLAGAKAYGASPELKAGMQKAGVQGPPEISFVEEVEDQGY
jgi:quinol monooxygenase YgiN